MPFPIATYGPFYHYENGPWIKADVKFFGEFLGFFNFFGFFGHSTLSPLLEPLLSPSQKDFKKDTVRLAAGNGVFGSIICCYLVLA